MDSLKTLMDKHQYELVLKITKTATDYNSLFYRISALLATGDPDAALNCILANRKELQKKLGLLIKVHIEILCIIRDFDKAYDEMDYYENLPYESQVVEETLRKYRKYIREQEKAAVGNKDLSDEDIFARLQSDKPGLVLDGLQAIRDKEVAKYLPFIEKILVSFKFQAIRSFALMLLVEKKLNKEIKFLHIDKIIDVNPSLLEPPFRNKEFVEFVQNLQQDFKNPSLSQNAANIYSSYLIYIYPDVSVVPDKVMLCALYGIANVYMQVIAEKSFEEKCEENGVKVKDAEKVIEELKKSIENFQD